MNKYEFLVFINLNNTAHENLVGILNIIGAFSLLLKIEIISLHSGIWNFIKKHFFQLFNPPITIVMHRLG